VPGEDDDLFPEWDEWLKLEKEGGATEAINGQKGESEPEAEAEAEDDDSEEDEE
jgi:coatomer subunit beta'